MFNGFIGVFDILFKPFAINTPEAVPIANASAPSTKIPIVSTVKNCSAASLEPTASPKNMVVILIISFLQQIAI